ncbi:MAG: hypothetical protein HY908_21330 [Myxococcales bacterium]|nr:hypothetical protein [Myxococcales bacterium]
MTGALLPLRLVEEHLDELGTSWLFRRGLVFSMRALPEALGRADGRIRKRLRALSCERAGAVREAELRLHSAVGWQRLGALRALLELSPGSVRDASGQLRVRRTRDFALLDALRHGPVAVARWLDDVEDGAAVEPAVLDAVSFSVRPSLLASALGGEGRLRRAALLAAARHPETAPLAIRGATEALRDPEVETRLVGAYALGLAEPGGLARRVAEAAAHAEIDPLVLGLFGGPAVVDVLLSGAREALLADDHVLGLGLAGDPRALPWLVDLCEGADRPGTCAAAVHALRCITGEPCVRPSPRRRSGDLLDALTTRSSRAGDVTVAPASLPDTELEPDLERARALLRSSSLVGGERYHLGVPLDAEVELGRLPMSFGWLRAVTQPERRADAMARALACEVPDALVPGEGYGALSMGPDHLFAARKALA